MYLRRKVYAAFEDYDGEIRLFSTKDVDGDNEEKESVGKAALKGAGKGALASAALIPAGALIGYHGVKAGEGAIKSGVDKLSKEVGIDIGKEVTNAVGTKGLNKAKWALRKAGAGLGALGGANSAVRSAGFLIPGVAAASAIGAAVRNKKKAKKDDDLD